MGIVSDVRDAPPRYIVTNIASIIFRVLRLRRRRCATYDVVILPLVASRTCCFWQHGPAQQLLTSWTCCFWRHGPATADVTDLPILTSHTCGFWHQGPSRFWPHEPTALYLKDLSFLKSRVYHNLWSILSYSVCGPCILYIRLQIIKCFSFLLLSIHLANFPWLHDCVFL